MALPKSYLMTVKNLEGILQAIQTAKAPERFTVRFLESLDFKSTTDRLVIGVLKMLGFVREDGAPTQRYFEFLDQTQSARILRDAIQEAYADLFAVNVNAHKMSREELINKLRTLSQGQLSDAVIEKMAMTFTGLVKLADFEAPPSKPATPSPETETLSANTKPPAPEHKIHEASRGKLGGLVYNIQIVLPESRDPAVYDALFRALKEHLL